MTATQALGWATIVSSSVVAIAVAYLNNRRTSPTASSSDSTPAAPAAAPVASVASQGLDAVLARLKSVEERMDAKDEELNLLRNRLGTAIHLIRRLLEGDEVPAHEIPAWVMEE